MHVHLQHEMIPCSGFREVQCVDAAAVDTGRNHLHSPVTKNVIPRITSFSVDHHLSTRQCMQKSLLYL